MRVELRNRKGLIGVVELDADGVAVPDEGAARFLDGHVIVKPGEPRRRLYPSDGREFLEALPVNLRGTFMWATAPIE